MHRTDSQLCASKYMLNVQQSRVWQNDIVRHFVWGSYHGNNDVT